MTWVEQMCGVSATMINDTFGRIDLDDINLDYDEMPVAELKARELDGLRVALAAAERFRAGVRALPVPDVQGGPAVMSRVRELAEALVASAAGQLEQLAQVATVDRDEYDRLSDDIQEEHESLVDQVQELGEVPELEAAAERAQFCGDEPINRTPTPLPTSTPEPVLEASATPSVSATAGYLAYHNARFGYSLDVPSAFLADESDNGDGRVFTSPDDSATLRVSAGYNIDGTTAQELLEQEVARLEVEDYDLTLSRVEGDEVTISGFTPDGDTVLYLRVVVREVMTTITWLYPVAAKDTYDPMVERAVSTLEPAGEAD